MSSGRAGYVAAGILLLDVAFTATAIVLAILNARPRIELVVTAVIPLFAFVGALVIARRPGNPMGWIFSAIGLLWASGSLSEEYAIYAYVNRTSPLPGVGLAAWYSEWFWIPFLFCLLIFTPLLFPTGRPVSPRWRPVLRVVAGGATTLTLLAMLDPRLSPRDALTVSNPIGISSLGDVEEGLLGGVFWAFALTSLVTGAYALIVRFVRSRGDERLQLKWFTYAATALVIGFVLQGVLDAVFEVRYELVDALLFLLVPASAGIAILKYRLYDIDLIINRTLVYAALTAALALTYFGLVVLLQQLVTPVAAGSDLAIAGSTLAVAALFGPARARIQVFIDRRFYRHKYDAAKTLEAFSSRLRDEVDLDALTKDLLGVVRQTMAPAHVSLWTRTPHTS